MMSGCVFPKKAGIMLIIALVSLLIGMSKGGLGAVIVGLVTPLLSQLMPVPKAVATALPLLIFADAFALWVYWKDWDMRHIRLLLPLALVGIIAGMFVLISAPEQVLRPLLAVFTLSAVVYRLLSRRLIALRYHHRNWHGYLAGLTSGFGSAVANVGAPPFTAYMLLQEMSPRVFIGTTTLFFAIINLSKLPWSVQLGLVDFPRVMWALPLVPVGVWLGRRFVDWVNPRVFEWFMIITLIIASISLLL